MQISHSAISKLQTAAARFCQCQQTTSVNIKQIKLDMTCGIKCMELCNVYSCASLQGGPKKPSPYIVLFVLMQHLFRCTNNTPCELKFCCAHTKAQTKFVCQKFVWGYFEESKYPQHQSQWQNTRAICACVYVSNNDFIQ